MHKLQEVGLKRIIDYLNSTKCKYKIVADDGTIYSNMPEKDSKRNSSFYPYGELTSYIRRYIDGIEIGKVIAIPVDKYDAERIASTVSSHLCKKFGNGSCVTHRKENEVEVLRMY